jgi:hypothetical protein
MIGKKDLRLWLLVAASALVGCLLATAASADVTVDCDRGERISDSLRQDRDRPLVLSVRGTCNENIVITRDDVTIKTNGTRAASIVAADSALPAISLDGAHRIMIDGVIASGISVSGGTFGIVASRGSSLEVANCAVSGASNAGFVSSTSSVVTVDACSVTGNLNGVVAANAGSVYVTNSTVSGNSGTGLIATRSSHLRVGQDRPGNVVVKPVTVSGNSGNGIAITEGSSGNVVGGTVETSGASNIFVGRASSGQIGLGVNGLTGGVMIQRGSGNGIAVEGGNATIVYSTIAGNAVRGIVVSNAGSARIGVTNSNAILGGNTISGNTTDGIGIFHGAGAFVGGNTIDANLAFGINVGQAAAAIVGGNAVTNNGQTGIFVRAGQVLIGDPGFGAPTTANTISGNGKTGPNNGGIFAFEAGNFLVTDATISNNTGAAVQAFEAGVIELRGTTAVTVPAAGTTSGALVQFGSTLRLRDSASIVSATSHGIQASNLTSVNIRDGNTVQGNGAGALGVLCFATFPMTASAATLTGNLAGVTGNAAASTGCNVFP